VDNNADIKGLNLDKVLKGTADAKARKIRFY